MRRCAPQATSRARADGRALRGRRIGKPGVSRRPSRPSPPHTAGRALAWPVALALCLPGPPPRAAAYLPGAAEPDPPTGEPSSPAIPAEPLRGTGIRWALGPIRQSGSLALDLRALRLDNGTSSRQAVVAGDIDWASYVWEPWFIQLRAGLGLVAGRDHASSEGGAGNSQGSTGLTGRVAVAVFPASRFPFELRAEVSDSRSRGDTLGLDTRTERLSLSQSWRPARGNDSVQLQIDRSRLLPQDGSSDTLTALQLVATRQLRDQFIELGGQFSRNDRSDTGQSTSHHALNARHSWTPSPELRVESMATQSQLRLRSDNAAELGSDVRQVATFASWRPDPRHPLYRADSPLQVTASARWVESEARSGDSGNRLRAVNATLGVVKEYGRHWRVAGAAAFGRTDGSTADATTSGSANANLSYTPDMIPLGAWQYIPSASASLALSQSSAADSDRRAAGLQFNHAVSRSVPLGEGSSLAFNLAQNIGLIRESSQAEMSRAIAHSASVFWQEYSGGADQTYAGLSVSDSRTRAQERGSFQLVNLQFTRRTQLARFASWSANLTVQATRSDTASLDPFSGQVRSAASGWQQYHSGSVSYENQRAFGVPRLRFTLLLSASSAQLERRAAGDIDAPRERISESLEARLDYGIGRLETRLSARHAQVDGRPVTSVFARVQRRF